jgi:hypothetical protein
MTRGFTVACVLATVSLVASARPLAAQEMDVPVDVQLPILLKVLTFDRKLATRAPDEVVVAVAFQGGNRASVVAKDAALRILRATPQLAEGVPLRVVTVDLDDTTLDVAHAAERITHLYLTPLRATDVRGIAGWARKAGITTMSGVTRHVENGLALGVGMRGGRPRILVNVEASRLEGAELSAELLKLAEIVQ